MATPAVKRRARMDADTEPSAETLPVRTSRTESQRSSPPTESKPFVAMEQVPMALYRLRNACGQAGKAICLARELAGDPDFRRWLDVLSAQHEAAEQAFCRLCGGEDDESRPAFSVRGWLQRLWMKLAGRVLPTAEFVLMDMCRREEYHLQTAYEVALRVLPPGDVRDSVEHLFQRFIVHRPPVPAGRLAQTRQLLQQAEQVQCRHSPVSKRRTEGMVDC